MPLTFKSIYITITVLSTPAPWAHFHHHHCYKDFGHSTALGKCVVHSSTTVAEFLKNSTRRRDHVFICGSWVQSVQSIALKPGWSVWCEKLLVLWEAKAERKRSWMALQSQRLPSTSSASWKLHRFQTAAETTDRIVNLWPLGNVGEPNHNKGVIGLHLFLTSNITSGMYHEESRSKQEVSWFSRQYRKCWIWEHPHQTRTGILGDQPH